jgi:hypothetical protein
MATAFKTVQDAIQAALLQAPQITGARVYTGRARPMAEEHANDISVSLESMTGQQFALGSGPVLWEVVYGLEIRARGSSSVDAVAAVDPLLEDLYERILATATPAGVEGWAITPRIRVDVDEASTPIASLQLGLNVRLRTEPGTLTLAA